MESKIINGIETEKESKCKFKAGRLYPLHREDSNRFPQREVLRVFYDGVNEPHVYGDHEPNNFSQMSASDFDLKNLIEAGVDLKEVSVNMDSPLNATFMTEQVFNREMNNPKNFEE